MLNAKEIHIYGTTQWRIPWPIASLTKFISDDNLVIKSPVRKFL
jgi:hypothetical protein